MPETFLMQIDGRLVWVLTTGFDFACGLIEVQRLDRRDRIELLYFTQRELEKARV